MLARYAEVKESLGVDAGVFGLLITGYMVGSASASAVPGIILRRIGTAWATVLGTVGVALAFVVAAVGVAVGMPWLFVLGLALAGFLDAVTDVAQNSQGLRVQEAYGRSVLTSMHAGWSIGAASGAAYGTLMASSGVSLTWSMVAWGALCSVVIFFASRRFLPDHAEGGDGDTGARIGRKAMLLLLPIVLVALAGIIPEDVGNNWSAVLLSSERGLSPETAGIGLSVLLAAQFVGRVFGDRVIDTFGRHRTLVWSLSILVAGLLVAAWAPNVALTLVGLALAGLGCAVTVPLAFAEADAIPGLKAHSGLTWINWIMRAATVVLTPLIGLMTDVFSLPVAITVMTMIGVAALATQVTRARSG